MRKLKYLYYFPVYISSEMFLMTVELMFLYPINIFSSFMKLWQYYSWKINLFSLSLLVGSGNKSIHKIKLRNFDNNRKFILAFVPQLMCWPLLSPLLFILSLHVKKKKITISNLASHFVRLLNMILTGLDASTFVLVPYYAKKSYQGQWSI